MGKRRILVATDVRLRRTSDGSALSTHPAALYETFAPLAQVYGTVSLFAREAPEQLPTVGLATGRAVHVAGVPNFNSSRSLIGALPRILWRAWLEVGRHDMVLGRVPEPLSLVVGWIAVLRRRPFVANVVADPTKIDLGNGLAAHLAEALLLAAARGLVGRSDATIYVTESYLQQQCPPPRRRPTLVRSNVRMDESWFRPPRAGGITGRGRVVLVGSNQSWNKGQLVLLEAAASLAREGTIVDLTFVGGGRLTEAIRKEARRQGLPGRVDVLGQVESREQLAAILDEHDVFCLPSLGEGLPRAMIEAMARGLPAVGSRVGGIPELLPEDAVCSPGDPEGLARALRNVLGDPNFGARSAASVERAHRVARQASAGTLVNFLEDVERRRENRAPRRA